MAMLIPATTNKPKILIPADTHVAVLTQCIDLGVQDGGNYGPKRKLRLGFQIPGVRTSFEKDGIEETGPAMIGEEYSFTLGTDSKPSNLRKVIVTLRGNRPITDQEAKSIDVAAFLGKVCLVGVYHKPSKTTGITYANINGIMTCPPKLAAGVEHEGEFIEYSPDAHNPVMWARIPRWIQERIEGRIIPETPAQKPVSVYDQPASEPFSDDIPFGNDERGVFADRLP